MLHIFLHLPVQTFLRPGNSLLIKIKATLNLGITVGFGSETKIWNEQDK